MRRIFGTKKMPPPPADEDNRDSINKKCDLVNEKIKILESELCRYREQIKRTMPGPGQEAIKARALRVLKQKKMLMAGTRGKEAFYMIRHLALIRSHSHLRIAAVKTANRDISGKLKASNINDIDKLQHELNDIICYKTQIHDTLGKDYNVPNDLDEEELLGELDALEADMGMELHADGMPAYLQPDFEPELNLPSTPTGYG
eukprot:c23198_g1_i1 orf=433-1038(+)